MWYLRIRRYRSPWRGGFVMGRGDIKQRVRDAEPGKRGGKKKIAIWGTRRFGRAVPAKHRELWWSNTGGQSSSIHGQRVVAVEGRLMEKMGEEEASGTGPSTKTDLNVVI